MPEKGNIEIYLSASHELSFMIHMMLIDKFLTKRNLEEKKQRHNNPVSQIPQALQHICSALQKVFYTWQHN